MVSWRLVLHSQPIEVTEDRILVAGTAPMSLVDGGLTFPLGRYTTLADSNFHSSFSSSIELISQGPDEILPLRCLSGRRCSVGGLVKIRSLLQQ